MKLHDFKLDKLSLLLPIYFYSVTFVTFFFYLYWYQLYSIDIEAFLYLGSRYLDGHLNFIDDFETKFPFVQFLFSIPYLLGGVGAWRILVFLFCFLFSIVSGFLFYNFIINWLDLKANSKYRIITLFSSTFLAVIYSLPGAESSHLEMISASSVLLSLVLFHLNIEFHKIRYVIFCSLFLALATLLRPNYIYLAFVIFFFDFIISIRYKHRLPGLFLSGLVFVLIIAFGFFPYFEYPNWFEIIFNGMVSIKDFHIKTDWRAVLIAQFLIPLVNVVSIVFLFISLFFYIGFRNKKFKLNKHVVLLFLGIFSVEYSFFSTHYFSHYAIMLVPFLLILSFFTYYSHKLYFSSFINKVFSFFIMSLVLYLPISNILVNSEFTNPFDDFKDINKRRYDSVLLGYLEKEQSKNKSFLVVYGPIYHSMLIEPRVGDGHPLMLRDLLQGHKIGPVNDIELYKKKNINDVCNYIVEQKDIFVLTQKRRYMYNDEVIVNELMESCFTKKHLKMTMIHGEHGRVFKVFYKPSYVDS